jgi:hypothetical protein
MNSNRSSKSSKGHHVIPAYLLGQFAPETETNKKHRERMVWVYEKNREPDFRSIENECKENHYFSITGADGSRSTSYEKFAADKVETPFNEVLNVIESPLYFANRSHARTINRYVANIFNRSKQRREASKINAQEIQSASERIANDRDKVRLLAAAYSLRLGQRMFIASIAESLRRGGDSIGLEERERDNDFVRRLDTLDDQLVEMLTGRPYGILVAPFGKFFVLGDNPVVTRTPYRSGFLVGDGFSKPNVHVLMPISSRSCLQIGLQGSFSRTLLPDEVDMINRDVMSLAHRRIYAHQCCAPVEREMNQNGSTRKYRRNVFVMPPVRDEDLFNFMIQVALGMNGTPTDPDPNQYLWSDILL